MTHHETSTTHNQQPALPEGGISRYIEGVLADIKVSGLTPEQQRKVVHNHLVGSLLRGLGTDEGARTVDHIASFIGRKFIPEGGENETSWEAGITRKEGARRAVLDVASDPTMQDKMNILGSELRYPDGDISNPAMTNFDLIGSYLDTITTRQRESLSPNDFAETWQSVIKGELTDFVSNPHSRGPWELDENLGSDISSVRDDQKRWVRAVEIAKKAGVDMDLLTRSAEFMKAESSRDREIGARALLSASIDFDTYFGKD